MTRSRTGSIARGCWRGGLVAGVLALGCASTAPAPPTAGSATTQIHTLSDNWGSGLGCVPVGDVLTLRGRIRVEPFGKGSDDAVLRVPGGERWIVSYRATGVVLEHDGRRVEVTGRRCEKQGEAIAGPHLDLETLRLAD